MDEKEQLAEQLYDAACSSQAFRMTGGKDKDPRKVGCKFSELTFDSAKQHYLAMADYVLANYVTKSFHHHVVDGILD